jgi:hypothetical protein
MAENYTHCELSQRYFVGRLSSSRRSNFGNGRQGVCRVMKEEQGIKQTAAKKHVEQARFVE